MAKPDLSRNQDLAGQSVKQGGYTVTYDKNGYAKKAVKDGGASATSAKKTQNANNSAAHKEAYDAAARGDWDAAGNAVNKLSVNGDMKEANSYMQELQDEFGYNAEKYYKDKYEAVYGEGSWDGTTGTNQAPATQAPSVQAPSVGVGGAGSNGPITGGSITGSGSVSGGGSPITGGSLGDYLEQWFAAAKEQQQGAIDYTVSQGINELTRAEEDAQAQFQTQRNQIAADEAKAKDNQALYAEARGDKGGIGAAQYDSIMNTAAKNHQAVNQAQTKLSTDTARQIADLRAQGEFEKADKLLQLTQQYLSELLSLEKWSLEYQLSIDKFNAELQQWAKEFELAISDVTGVYNGMPTLNAIKTQYAMDEDAKKQLASAGETLLGLGIRPSASQLEAMGMTSAQAQEAITAAKMAAAAKSSGKGTGGGNPTKYPAAAPSYTSIYQTMKDAGIKNYDDAYAYLIQNDYTDGESKELASLFAGKIADGSLYVPAEKTAMQNGTTLDRMDFTDSIGNKLILNQSTGSGDNIKYFVSGVGWLSETTIEDGLYGGTLDLVFDPKNKNKYFVVEAVTIR